MHTYVEEIRRKLKSAIKTVSSNAAACVKNPGKDFTRNRKLPLQTVLSMLVGMGGGSLSKELCDWFNFDEHMATASAFIQQRDKIKPTAMEEIFHQFNSAVAVNQTWQGYRLLAVDGSDLRLPANPQDPISAIKNKETGKTYNLMHLNAMYDITNKVYLDALVQPKKGMNEHIALVTMVDRSPLQENTIVLMDRGYESFNNIAHFQEKSWNYIIRAKDSFGMVTNLELPNCKEFDTDILLTLTRRQTKETLSLLSQFPKRYRWIQPHTTFDYIQPKGKNFYDLNFRAVRFAIADNTYEMVYTNLDRQQFPPEKIRQLYFQRWNIETSFRELKYVADLSSLHGKKIDFVIQEIFARLTFFNYSSIIARSVPVPDGKRVNFSVALYYCRQFFKKKISTSVLLTGIAKNLSSIRPGRHYHRFPNIISAVAFQYRIP